MRDSGFYDPATSRRLLPRLRRLFGRIRLERDEINILRGIVAALQRKPD
jgi:tRNA/rRNA methyltransferase